MYTYILNMCARRRLHTNTRKYTCKRTCTSTIVHTRVNARVCIRMYIYLHVVYHLLLHLRSMNICIRTLHFHVDSDVMHNAYMYMYCSKILVSYVSPNFLTKFHQNETVPWETKFRRNFVS
jgi:hypothetical protein